MSKAETTAIGALILIGLPIVGAIKLFETVGWVMPVTGIVGAVILMVWYQHAKSQRRLSELREKYQDEEVVQKIFQGYFWQGQSQGQLQDALGPPVDVDHRVLKTKTRDVWKYQHQGGNRYGLRITLENGFVTGWDKKA
jgi:hypothetical protein